MSKNRLNGTERVAENDVLKKDLNKTVRNKRSLGWPRMRWKDVEGKEIGEVDGNVGLAFDDLEITACRRLGPR